MSGGGAGVPGAFPARALALAALALLPSLATLAPDAAAQSPGDPWWGPTDRARPTDGWAVRVPVVVENPFDFRLVDALVAVDLDFAASLSQAGWTTTPAVLGAARLRGFTLDVDSLRVVEYGRGFGPGPVDGASTKALAHHFYRAPFDRKALEFDAAANPAGTLSFVMKGALDTGQKRFFYVYANPLEFGKTAPPQFAPADLAPLEGYGWNRPGVVVSGFEPNQPGEGHLVRAMVLGGGGGSDATVTMYEWNNVGSFVPARPLAAHPNPATVIEGGSTSFLVTPGRAWKIVSDKPIVVASTGGSGEDPLPDVYVPSTDGTYAGRFFVPYEPKSRAE
ncbi:MAG TPA: hypothetical protein VHH36_06945, partial [Candidatus Thermoplasmatota archaeon]|nr:hypothetical protein [Candidatus Thermoplasmatota archaeon]